MNLYIVDVIYLPMGSTEYLDASYLVNAKSESKSWDIVIDTFHPDRKVRIKRIVRVDPIGHNIWRLY